MSRVIGLLSNFKPERQRHIMEKMLSISCLAPGWEKISQISGNAAFGYTGRHKPNIASRNNVLVVMDGFVYNRAEFGTYKNDADLLLGLYMRYGFQKSLSKINGDFAIALYDVNDDSLFLARDRFGIKPLYYVPMPEMLVFASRIRALLSAPGITHNADREFVARFAGSHYRYFDNNPGMSPYTDIKQLPAAHMLHVKNGDISEMPYWQINNEADHAGSEETLAERYRELLLDSVSLRLSSARRPAFTLSGGMDSSSVLSSAVHRTGLKQYAFSTVYTDKTYDESDEIRSMLDTTVEKWHPVQIGTPDVFRLIREMIAVHDEPVATATWLSHFLLCREASGQGFDGLFGGLGGDELNAGEYEHFFFHFADLLTQGKDKALKHEVEMWIRYHDHPTFRKNAGVVNDALGRLVDIGNPGRCLPDRKRLARYASVLNPEYFDIEKYEPAMDHPFDSYLKNRTYQDIFRETAPCCLRAEDRQTMAFGLDNFLPFFDHRLVEFMFKIPGSMKIRDGITKFLLREAMRGILPEETRKRIKKTGWNAPAHLWFSGDGKEQLYDMVNSQAFRERGIYNVGEVRKLLDEHDRIVFSGIPQENHMMFLWQMVNLELWLRSLEEIRNA